MGRIGGLLILCLVVGACQTQDIPRPRGSIPGEWVAEAWYSTGSWIQTELFPCQICFGFHGDVSEEGGPAHLVPDHRMPVICPECQGVGRRACTVCGGVGGRTCPECRGFGIVDCPDCDMVRVKDVVVAKPRLDDKVVSGGCPECDWKGGDCPECAIRVPNLDHLKVPDRGEIRYTSRHPCKTCRSRGWLDCPYCREGIQVCPRCRNRSYERKPCPMCGGQGVLWPKHLEFKLRRVRKRASDRRK